MQIYEAREIVKNLADGMDPVTGEVFPVESCYQHPQIIRALYIAVESFDLLKKSRKRSTINSKAGSPWTSEEEEQLISAFDAGLDVSDLAKAHSRTPAAITARLQKLGKLEGDSVAAPV